MSETVQGTAIAMTWEEYEALPEDIRTEYVDGMAIVNPEPTKVHQRAARRLANALEAACTEAVEVLCNWGWKPGSDQFGPDVMVIPVTEENVRFTGIPYLVVEILSSNRSHDLVRKFRKYAAAGAPRYLILDPRDTVLIAYELQGGDYVEVAKATGDQSLSLHFGPGVVEVCPSDLLA